MAETILTWQPVAIAIAGGVLPSLVWLWFWLKQDSKAPEPTGLIALSFFAGMAIVYFVLPLQKLVVSSMSAIMDLVDTVTLKFTILPPDEATVRITLWAFIEEFAKFATVFLIAFKSKFFDEPKDAVIYLITAALGFAAMENTLYIFNALASHGGSQALHDGAMRFIGPTTVHIVSSAFVGVAIAFAFYAPRYIKLVAAVIGILTASLLHAYFNLSLDGVNGTIKEILTFYPFWGAIIAVIVLFALVHRMSKRVSGIRA